MIPTLKLGRRPGDRDKYHKEIFPATTETIEKQRKQTKNMKREHKDVNQKRKSKNRAISRAISRYVPRSLADGQEAATPTLERTTGTLGKGTVQKVGVRYVSLCFKPVFSALCQTALCQTALWYYYYYYIILLH